MALRNKYYKVKQIIARINRKGKILDGIDRWRAHEKGELHRAFTVTLVYKNKYILQHRKHPVFDGVFDLTSSSHQSFENHKLQDSVDAVLKTLKREWNITKRDLVNKPKLLGEVYYKANDKNSKYKEHEVCEIFKAEVKNKPEPNYDWAYGYSMLSEKELIDKNSGIYQHLAPWAKKAIEENLI